MSEKEIEKVVEEAKEEVIDRPYALRKFKDSELFLMLQILKKLGIKDCKEEFFQVASGEKSFKQIGTQAVFAIVDILVTNLEKVEDELYSLYSDMSGIPVDEMKDMEFGTLPLMIIDSFSEVKNTSFFKVLSKLL